MSLKCQRGLLKLSVALMALPLLGCGADTETLSNVEGQVLLDGKPLTTGTVVTQPATGPAARGEIGSDGRFVLVTRDAGDGAVPGLHRVGVVAFESSDPQNPESPSKALVPQKYNNPLNSGLTINVKAGETNDVTLPLSSRP